MDQKRYDQHYDEMVERYRPKPKHELGHLEGIARLMLEDTGDSAAAPMRWAAMMNPENFLAALAAERWDREHPYYACIECEDGKLLPEGYVCRVCGSDNPRNT